ncbi:DegT/DnrJ/EryC1/StrS family aminotransferase [Kiloniella sp. b19]|uniref:DegT/DnrJ/EryC1/StrS family aminotransferase n=1 Tax=Kiloniella sp. GXU_MW_B19 TaxID=3141326 RepID=UPI0031D07B1A
MFYPYSRQHITQEDQDAVLEALHSDFLTQGPKLTGFENDLARYLGDDCQALACNNGTSALWIAYSALGLGPEAGLLTTPVTFLASASAALMLNAPVALADVDPDTGLLTAETVEKALKHSSIPIRAITVVHLGGQAGELEEICRVAKEHNCFVIEDACHGLGATVRTSDGSRSYLGSSRFSDVAVFSFHAIKHLSLGEGGACISRNRELMEKMRLLRNHGMTRNPEDWDHAPEAGAPWYYEMHAPSFNMRLPEMEAALGISQLKRLDEANRKRREIARLYEQELAGTPYLECPERPDDSSQHAWHLYPVKIDFEQLGRSRTEVMNALKAKGVGTQVHYIPLYRQPWYRKRNYPFLEGAETYYNRTLSIPMYPQLSSEDVFYISDALKTVLKTNR